VFENIAADALPDLVKRFFIFFWTYPQISRETDIRGLRFILDLLVVDFRLYRLDHAFNNKAFDRLGMFDIFKVHHEHLGRIDDTPKNSQISDAI
jgi:hypothetical protein